MPAPSSSVRSSRVGAQRGHRVERLGAEAGPHHVDELGGHDVAPRHRAARQLGALVGRDGQLQVPAGIVPAGAPAEGGAVAGEA